MEDIKRKLEQIKKEGEQAIKNKAVSEGRLSEMKKNLERLLGDDTIEELQSKLQNGEDEIQKLYAKLIEEYDV